MLDKDGTKVAAFYNMQATILFQGRLLDEKIAIKHVWEKETNVIIDVYFYNSKQSKIIDAAYIKSVKDLNTEKIYTNVYEFIEDFKDAQKRLHEKEESIVEDKKPEINITYLKDIKDELIILAFLSQQSKSLSDVKRKVITDFIKRRKIQAENLSEQYVGAYLDSLNIDDNIFAEALNNLSQKSIDSVTELLKEAVKISATDGVISYQEKKLLAEILQTFREHNVEPDIEF